MAKREIHAPVGNMIIGQSGGPTVVINQSLIGAIMEARQHSRVIKKIYGTRHGVDGILKQDLIDLTNEPESNLRKVGLTPSSALGSVRHKPTPDECKAMFKVLAAHDVRYFFYIGGNDSAETTHIVQQVALENHYPLHVFHIPKTIDNDLRGTDHSPGFGSAAKFVAQAFMGDDMDNRSLKGIKIDVVMGRGAGFLTAASALGRARADSGPHLIYVPEVAFDEKRFLADVKRVYAKLGRCVIAVSEGIRDRAGVLIAKEFSQEVDSHGNAQLSGSGAMGDYLAGVIKRKLGNDLRVRADTFGYLQRSFAGVWSETDVEEARRVGEFAVANAATGAPSGTVSMIRHRGKKYAIDYKLSPLSLVARETTELPRRFLNKDGNNVTRAFIDYALPLVGHLPRIGFLEGKPVKKWKLR